MIKRVLYTLFVSALFAASCRCHDAPCIPGGLCIELHGFDSAELQGITIRRFDTSGFYTNLLQTTPCYGTRSDTVNDTPHILLGCGVSGGYNWEIAFPAIPKTVRIYEMRYPAQSERVCNSSMERLFRCSSAISSYNQDGIAHQTVAAEANHSDCVQIYR